MFQPIDYLEWVLERLDAAAHDLGSSDLRPAAVDHGEHVVPPVLADLPAPDPDGAAATALLAERYGVDESQVALTAGTTHANVLVYATALDPPAEQTDAPPRVLCESPGYEPHHATPESLGAEAWRFRRDDGELDPDRVEGALDDSVDVVTVSNRHNPTARLVPRDTLREVAEACAPYDAVLHVDEVYGPYTVDRGDGPFGGVTAADLPNTVVTNSLTKFFGLGGLRFGWVVGDPSFVDDLDSAGLHLPDLSQPSRALGRRALANADELTARAREHLAANHVLLEAFVDGRSDLAGTVHDGAPYALLSHERADGDRVAEAAWDRDLLVVPGRFFGAPDAVRVSVGGGPDAMGDALSVFGTVLDEL